MRHSALIVMPDVIVASTPLTFSHPSATAKAPNAHMTDTITCSSAASSGSMRSRWHREMKRNETKPRNAPVATPPKERTQNAARPEAYVYSSQPCASAWKMRTSTMAVPSFMSASPETCGAGGAVGQRCLGTRGGCEAACAPGSADARRRRSS